MKKKIITLACLVSVVTMLIAPLIAYADSSKIITIGADLTDEQKDKVYSFFNANLDEVEVIEVNNAEERKYLEGTVDDSIIGHRTLSCAYINPNTHDGIMVKTANLTWVTAEMIGNALLTAGVTNCEVIATAPFEVSGTGALIGIFKAYETSTGEALDEDKKELATEEIIISAEISSDVTDNDEADIPNLMSDIKQDLLTSDDDIDIIVKRNLRKYAIELTEEQLDKLIAWVGQFKGMNYDKSAFEDSLNKFSENIDKMKNIDFKSATEPYAEEAMNWLQKLWNVIVEFFKDLFGDSEESDSESTEEALAEDNIFQQANEDVFSFDNEESNSDIIESKEIIDMLDENETDTVVSDEKFDDEFQIVTDEFSSDSSVDELTLE